MFCFFSVMQITVKSCPPQPSPATLALAALPKKPRWPGERAACPQRGHAMCPQAGCAMCPTAGCAAQPPVGNGACGATCSQKGCARPPGPSLGAPSWGQDTARGAHTWDAPEVLAGGTQCWGVRGGPVLGHPKVLGVTPGHSGWGCHPSSQNSGC